MNSPKRALYLYPACDVPWDGCGPLHASQGATLRQQFLTFSRSNSMHTFRRYAVIFGASCTLLLAAGCKKNASEADDKAATVDDGDGIVFRDGFMEQTLTGNTQGTRDASALEDDCVGFLPEEPTAEISFREDLPMRIHVVTDDDLVLAIQHGDTYYCNDDFDRHQPSIARMWEEGDYNIFIGTKEKDADPVLYELNFDHYNPDRPLEPTPREDEDAADALGAFEPPLLENASSTIQLEDKGLTVNTEADPHFDTVPYVPNGISHMDFDLENADLDARDTALDADNCPVKVDPNRADFIMNMLADGDLHAAVQSNANIGLVLAGANGDVYCAAPEHVQDLAVLRFENMEEGRYAIYLGEAVATPQDTEEDRADDDAPMKDDADGEDSAKTDGNDDDAPAAPDAEEAEDADDEEAAPLRGRLHFY